ncbi:thioredoxin domain-containing protein 3 homolog isoform X2 [Phymastichus coffea]|uniref:thioredoxin domain-containing protein 3 homolog isoform X2 n=1 Tax=Phymastichus coffea TaxID=108790 RepID=UPI00273A9404|nr:thioredoxin domain-containing protein 3 homolog isoform X2 [Phymastichus coffea]
MEMCDCTSEDSDEPKARVRQAAASDDSVQADAIELCDCTSDDDTRASPCSCRTSEESSQGKVKIGEDSAAGSEDISMCPLPIVQVELRGSMLNLASSSASSTSVSAPRLRPRAQRLFGFACSQCDCASSTGERKTRSSRSSHSKTEPPSCDCTSAGSESASAKSEAEEKKLEWTLAIIKPEALKFQREIERAMEEEGFGICQRRRLHLTAEQASEFYCDDYERKEFARLVEYMSSKPIAVYALGKVAAISEWRLLIGPSKVSEARLYAPDSIRARYGTVGDDARNAVHGSRDERAAVREIRFFFPDRAAVAPLLRGEAAEEYLWRSMGEVLSEGLAKVNASGRPRRG